eukprot:6794778-Heterocapsa_arctica.AAC.1
MHKPVETGGKRTPSKKNGRLALKHVMLMLLYTRILDVKRVLRAHTARLNFVPVSYTHLTLPTNREV